MAESQQEQYHRKLNEDRSRSERAARLAEKERVREERKRERDNHDVYSGMYGPNSDL